MMDLTIKELKKLKKQLEEDLRYLIIKRIHEFDELDELLELDYKISSIEVDIKRVTMADNSINHFVESVDCDIDIWSRNE